MNEHRSSCHDEHKGRETTAGMLIDKTFDKSESGNVRHDELMLLSNDYCLCMLLIPI
jgi:hypothetical protein